MTTNVPLSFEVELLYPLWDGLDTASSSSSSTSDFVTQLPILVQGAAVEAMYNHLCDNDEDDDENENAKLSVGLSNGTTTSSSSNTLASTETSLKISPNCIYSISAAGYNQVTYCIDNVLDERHSNHTTTSSNNFTMTNNDNDKNNCLAIQGDFKIFHKPECLKENVASAAYFALQHDVNENVDDQNDENGHALFLESINSRFVDEDNAVQRVMVIFPHNIDYETMRNDTTIGSSPAAIDKNELKIAAVGYVMLSVAGLVLCWLLWALWRRRQNDAQRALPKQDDWQSMRTDDDDGGSYQTADFGNLAQAHSKLDVHRCTSALCPVCYSSSSSPQAGEVRMIPVSDHRNYAVRASAAVDLSVCTRDEPYQGVEATMDSNNASPEQRRRGGNAWRNLLQRCTIHGDRGTKNTTTTTTTKMTTTPEPSSRRMKIDLESVSFVRVASALPVERDDRNDSAIRSCTL